MKKLNPHLTGHSSFRMPPLSILIQRFRTHFNMILYDVIFHFYKHEFPPSKNNLCLNWLNLV